MSLDLTLFGLSPEPDPFGPDRRRAKASPTEGDVPESVHDAPLDVDGVAIPTKWRLPRARKKWDAQPLSFRKSQSEFWIDGEIREAIRLAKPLVSRVSAGTFTTQYAVNWGRKQFKGSGLHWVVIDREAFDYRTKRHHDLQLGLDVLFDDGEPGMVGIQAAGKGEERAHYQRFIDRGGIETADRRNIRVEYHEYERGTPEPSLRKVWRYRPTDKDRPK